MAREDFDINNPQSMSIAIDQGLFTPQQTPAQEVALTKLEMAIALIEGWIDHVVTQVADCLYQNLREPSPLLPDAE